MQKNRKIVNFQFLINWPIWPILMINKVCQVSLDYFDPNPEYWPKKNDFWPKNRIFWPQVSKNDIFPQVKKSVFGRNFGETRIFDKQFFQKNL